MHAITKTKKVERVVARISAADKKLLKRAAAAEGRTLAGFLVAHAREAAQRALEEKNVIRLNEEESLAFAKLVLAPPRKLGKPLRDAVNRHRQTIEMR